MAKKEEKNKGGRPLLFASKKDLQAAIDKYLKECQSNIIDFITKDGDVIQINKPLIPTIAGLAYALGVDRQTIYNYSYRDEYFDTIKKTREYIISQIESKLANIDGNIAGTIFLAKNYGYSDKQEFEHSGKFEEKIIFVDNITE